MANGILWKIKPVTLQLIFPQVIPDMISVQRNQLVLCVDESLAGHCGRMPLR
jgi:hypothetical protein